MAIRIRENGRIFCAAMTKAENGDTYLHDGIHYQLSVIEKVLVTDDKHFEHAEWWWKSNVPPNIIISNFYKD